MSLLQFEDEVMPFTFADVLILRYLFNTVDAEQTVLDFDLINTASNLNWAFRSQVAKFIKRFFKDPYREEDTKWIKSLANENNVNIKEKFIVLSRLI